MPPPPTPSLNAQRVAGGEQLRYSTEPLPISSREGTRSSQDHHRSSTDQQNPRLSVRASSSGGHRRKEDQNKEPVLQLFVMPVGIPKRRGLRVVVEVDSSGAGDREGGAGGSGNGGSSSSSSVGGRILGMTQRSDRQDPLFNDPIELWSEGSGKDGSVTLKFSVNAYREGSSGQKQEEKEGKEGDTGNEEKKEEEKKEEEEEEEEETLAVARIKSDSLRRFGLYNPREGAAVALPLRTLAGEKLPLRPGARARLAQMALHCYVHVGYSVRRQQASSRLLGSNASGGGAAFSATGASSSGQSAAVDPSTPAGPGYAAHKGGHVATGQRLARLRLEYACLPCSDPLALLLLVRGRNASKRRVVELGTVDLRAPDDWEVSSPLVPVPNDADGGGNGNGSGGRASSAVASHAWRAQRVPPGGRFEICFSLLFLYLIPLNLICNTMNPSFVCLCLPSDLSPSFLIPVPCVFCL